MWNSSSVCPPPLLCPNMECDTQPEVTTPAFYDTNSALSPPPLPPPGTWCCKVCGKPNDKLNVLPCEHKFCERCLVLWVGIYIEMYRGHKGEFPCQICWTLVKIPMEGLHGFQQDFSVNNLDADLRGLSMDTSDGGCHRQRDSVPSTPIQTSTNQRVGWSPTHRDAAHPMCSYASIHSHLM